jgi:hypothetical protein
MTYRPKRPSMPRIPHDALVRMLTENIWTPNIRLKEDGLISWRHYAAAAMRDVHVESVAELLATAIERMEILTWERLIAAFEEQPSTDAAFQFQDWYAVWREHFDHWDDPVRQIIAGQCYTPDGLDFADRLHAADGQVLLDFALEACLSWSMMQRMGERAGLKGHPLAARFPMTLEDEGQERPITLLYRELYARFIAEVAFAYLPAPEVLDLELNFDRLFPTKPDPAALSDTEGAA